LGLVSILCITMMHELPGVDMGGGEDLELLSNAEGVGASQKVVHLRCARAHGILVGVLALIAVALASACTGHLARILGPDSVTDLAEEGTQLQDRKGRCLEPAPNPVKSEHSTILILTACRDNAKEQLFTVDAEAGLIQHRDGSGKVLCVEQQTFFSAHGRALFLEDCLPGWHLQRLVGACLEGDTPKDGTYAFAKPCDPKVEPPQLGVSLFCFMAVLPDSGEVALMENAKSRDPPAGIFACEGNKVYWSENTGMMHNEQGETYTPNAGVFGKLWQQVFDDKLYRPHDWTIKVDADTCFMPQRLRDRLPGLGTHIQERAYVLNTRQSFGFLGAIEILSQQAVARLADRAALWCPAFGNEGEDGWIKSCMDLNNVSAKEDRGLLNSRCSVDDCSDTSFAAFHFYKTPDVWNQCYDRMQWR